MEGDLGNETTDKQDEITYITSIVNFVVVMGYGSGHGQQFRWTNSQWLHV